VAAVSSTPSGSAFAPGIAPALLGVPAHELRDRRVDLTDLWPGSEGRDIAERVAATTDPAAALESAALRRMALAGPPDPLLRAVVDGLDAGRTVASVAENRRPRHPPAAPALPGRLRLRSQDPGARPAPPARARARTGVGAVRGGAVVAGYADQAHLARETRDLAGLTLGAYAALANSETPQPSGSSTTA